MLKVIGSGGHYARAQVYQGLSGEEVLSGDGCRPCGPAGFKSAPEAGQAPHREAKYACHAVISTNKAW